MAATALNLFCLQTDHINWSVAVVHRTAKGAPLDWKAASGHRSAFEAIPRPPLLPVGDLPPPGAYETVSYPPTTKVVAVEWHLPFVPVVTGHAGCLSITLTVFTLTDAALLTQWWHTLCD